MRRLFTTYQRMPPRKDTEMSKHRGVRLSLKEQSLLHEVFVIAVENYQYDNEEQKEIEATKLFNKLMVKTGA